MHLRSLVKHDKLNFLKYLLEVSQSDIQNETSIQNNSLHSTCCYCHYYYCRASGRTFQKTRYNAEARIEWEYNYVWKQRSSESNYYTPELWP